MSRAPIGELCRLRKADGHRIQAFVRMLAAQERGFCRLPQGSGGQIHDPRFRPFIHVVGGLPFWFWASFWNANYGSWPSFGALGLMAQPQRFWPRRSLFFEDRALEILSHKHGLIRKMRESCHFVTMLSRDNLFFGLSYCFWLYAY